MPKTLRLQILEAIQVSLAGMDAPEYPLKFSSVELGPLEDENLRKQYTAGVVPGVERKSNKVYPFVECSLSVTIEFRATRNSGDSASGVLSEELLGHIQKRMLGDRTLGGLSVDITEVSNEIDMDSYRDKSILGALMLMVLYRHHTDDPHVPLG